MPRPVSSPVIEPLGSDIVTIAQAIAIDADAFPYPSADLVLAPRDASAYVWVARRDEGARVVGFLASEIQKGDVLFVSGLAVDRSHRRDGIGRALVREAKGAAEVLGLGAVVLNVARGNESAIALYESEGFQHRRTLKDFYAPSVEGGRDALEMVFLVPG